MYIDTNVLAYLFRLHSTARRELLSWFAGLISQSRLGIPGWVVNEYTAKYKANKLVEYTPRVGPQGELARLENLYKDARAFVDDSIVGPLGYSSREEYLARFGQSLDELQKLMKVFKNDFEPSEIHKEIEEVLASAVLPTDIGTLCDEAGTIAANRFHHRLPPGFKDGGKSENSLGDLVLWLELLSHGVLVPGTMKDCVLISNDQKGDWTYLPFSRTHIDRAGKRIEIPNNDPTIRLLDPRLTVEYRAKTAGRGIHIVDIAALVEALSKVEPTRFQGISRAVQEHDAPASAKRDDAAKDEKSVAGEEPPKTEQGEVTQAIDDAPAGLADASVPVVPATPEAKSVEEAGRPMRVGKDGLRDSLYATREDRPIDQIIADLRSHNWYTQNPAIRRIRDLNGRYPWSSWFVLGRNVYQAAHGNASEARKYIENLDWYLEQFRDNPANAILGGMAYEIYFDSNGQFRGRPKVGNIDSIFVLLEQPRYVTAKNFIRDALLSHRDKLLYLPGDDKRFDVKIETELDETGALHRTVLRSVIFQGKELLVDFEDDPFQGWVRGTHNRTTASEIVQNLSDQYAIPRRLFDVGLSTEHNLATPLFIPDGKVLKAG